MSTAPTPPDGWSIAGRVDAISCDGCAFTMDMAHAEVGKPTTCPVCEESSLCQRMNEMTDLLLECCALLDAARRQQSDRARSFGKERRNSREASAFFVLNSLVERVTAALESLSEDEREKALERIALRSAQKEGGS